MMTKLVVAEYDAVADEKAAAISDPGPGSPPSLNHEVQQRWEGSIMGISQRYCSALGFFC